jgi:hypothetical protein
MAALAMSGSSIIVVANACACAGRQMNGLVILIPVALGLGLVGLASFFWSLRHRQLTIWMALRCASSSTRIPAGAAR